MEPVAHTMLVAQLRELGVETGAVLLLHSSFHKIGPVDGGPDVFIDALLEAIGPDGTLVMPSWTDDDDEPFDPRATSALHLGIVAETFRRRPGVVRGDHPFAVAALGPHARDIAGAPFVLPPHAPDSGIGRVYDRDGWVLLAGVDHDADTTIHLAELVAGAPYRRPKSITVLEDSEPRRIDYGENDSCCRGFNMVGDWLRARGRQREGSIGRAQATLARSRDIVETVVEELREDPTRFLCPRGTCEECDDAWRTVPSA